MKQWQQAAIEAAEAASKLRHGLLRMENAYRHLAVQDPEKNDGAEFIGASDNQAGEENATAALMKNFTDAQHKLGEAEDIEVKEEGIPADARLYNAIFGTDGSFKEQLEHIVDRITTTQVLELLAQIANEKADHAEENWQDPASAKGWLTVSERLQVALGNMPYGF